MYPECYLKLVAATFNVGGEIWLLRHNGLLSSREGGLYSPANIHREGTLQPKCFAFYRYIHGHVYTYMGIGRSKSSLELPRIIANG